MPQTLFKSEGVSEKNTSDINNIKGAGMAVSGVKWVNVNGDSIVATHEDDFDVAAFISAINSVGADVK